MNRLPAYWFKNTGKTQRRSVSLDAGAGVIASYSDYLTNVPMRLVVSGGGESGGQDRLNSQSPFAIYTGPCDIIATDRIVYSARVFDVQSINNFDESGVYQRCDCTEVQPSGVGA